MVLKPNEIRLLEQEYGPRCDRSLIYIILSFLIFGSLVTVTLVTHIFSGASQLQPHGAISSDVKVCSDIGIKILKKGGSAVDGAIATMFCLGVVNNAHSGIGGGGFMLIHSHKMNKTRAIDFREILPQGSPMPTNNPATAIGIPGEVKGMHLAHKLYGKIKWIDLIQPSIDLAQNGFHLTEATVKALRKIFKGAEMLATTYPKLAQIYTTTSPTTGVRFLEAGEMTKNPRLARTLQQIGLFGPDALYKGQIALGIVKTVNDNGGDLSLKELENYSPVEREPQQFNYLRGRFHVITLPPPSGGPVLSLVLRLMERLGVQGLAQETRADRVKKWLRERHTLNPNDNIPNGLPDPSRYLPYPTLYRSIAKHDGDPGMEDVPTLLDKIPANDSSTTNPLDPKEAWADGEIETLHHQPRPQDLDLAGPNTGLYYHWLVETLKFGQAYKGYLGDFSPMQEGKYDNESFNNVKKMWTGIFAGENLDEMVASISNVTTYDFTATSHYLPPDMPGTAHVSVIDQDELMVSVTSTLNNLFGSKHVTDDGILLNDQLYDFDLENNKSNNYPRPGKKPVSSMVPNIIYENDRICGLRMAVGGSNGTRIISGVVQVLLNILVFGDSLEDAMARPRLYPNVKKGYVEVEANFPKSIVAELVARNHAVVRVEDGLNTVLPIMKVRDTLWATSDPRKSEIQSAAIY